MDTANPDERSRSKAIRVATIIGFITAIVAAGAVSSATPDGNLIVTLVPALAIGLAAFGLAFWRFRRRRSA